MDLDIVADLLPVDKWVYNLYKVSYWDVLGNRLRIVHIASTASHFNGCAQEEGPCEWEEYTFEVLKENVSHPRVIGQLYGLPLHECARVHGERLAAQM